MTRSRSGPRATEAHEKEDMAASAAEADEEKKTPEQTLAEKLELDRFVERLRRKFH